MASSDSSIIVKLAELYDNTWNTLYKPLNIANTVVADHITEETLQDIENLKTKTEETDIRVSVLSNNVAATFKQINDKIDDVSTNIHKDIVSIGNKISDVSADIHRELNTFDGKIADVSISIHQDVSVLRAEVASVSEKSSETEEFVGSILHWENQDGSVL